uniref:Uncharacterized protein n=2 Tax=Anser TaxID=8842 RepID=A0A8B9BSF8_9AVES
MDLPLPSWCTSGDPPGKSLVLRLLCAPETIFLSHCSLQGRCHLFRRPAGKAGCWQGDRYFGVIPTPAPPFFLWLVSKEDRVPWDKWGHCGPAGQAGMAWPPGE